VTDCSIERYRFVNHIGGHADGIVIRDGSMMIEIKSIGIQSVRFEAFLYEAYEREQMTSTSCGGGSSGPSPVTCGRA
jgi:hypothetical protein